MLDNERDYGDARERTYTAYNLHLLENVQGCGGFWEMPVIENDEYIPDALTGFSNAKPISKENKIGIHFYLDDYRFERVWKEPERYVNILKGYGCILSPDFSLYTDMPMPMKIWNIYRSRVIGAYYQSLGMRVIPTISWAEPETYKFCFEGIPKGSVVSISTIGVKRDKAAKEIWRDGVTEMISRIEPSLILVYGGKIGYDYGNINVRYYSNEIVDKFDEIRNKKARYV